MAFHVEISSGMQHARAFNLDERRLRETIIAPWLAGEVIILGDQDWEPRKCDLKILEGPTLSPAELAIGRGWSNAEKASENVSRRMVQEAAVPPTLRVAILADTQEVTSQLAAMLGTIELERVEWSELRVRLLSSAHVADNGGAATRYAAILAVEGSEPDGAWLFDAGLARGALGPRAVLAQLGDSGIPKGLSGVDVMRLEPGDEASLRALHERLTGA